MVPTLRLLPLMLGAVLLAALLAPERAGAEDTTLQQSLQQRQHFPFRPDCDGNTQQIVACQWQRRNQGDATLEPLLGSAALLEQWRSSRRLACERAAARAEGGSIQPILGLSCENALNSTLIEQLSTPLAR